MSMSVQDNSDLRAAMDDKAPDASLLSEKLLDVDPEELGRSARGELDRLFGWTAAIFGCGEYESLREFYDEVWNRPLGLEIAEFLYKAMHVMLERHYLDVDTEHLDDMDSFCSFIPLVVDRFLNLLEEEMGETPTWHHGYFFV